MNKHNIEIIATDGNGNKYIFETKKDDTISFRVEKKEEETIIEEKTLEDLDI